MRQWSIFTEAVHAGERAQLPGCTPVATPVYHSASYLYGSMEELDAAFAGTLAGPVYARYGNPTNAALETAVATLEGAEAAISYGSGMAAIHGALLGAGAIAGTTVVAAQDLYGATFALLRDVLGRQGVSVHFLDVTDLAAVKKALGEQRPVAMLVETVSNPLVKIADIPRLAELAHLAGTALVVDNTFATPYLCRPLAMGADYTVHSATKYLSGHGDVMGGVVATTAARRARLHELIKLMGGNLGPQEAWLILRGIKTLPLRMQRQCSNARHIANWLAEQPPVAAVHYPGLTVHPQHGLASRLFGDLGFGAIVSFELQQASREAVFRFMNSLRLVLPATTLGDVYSLALYPAISSHRALDPETRRSFGIGDGLVRLSIGIEEPEDIIVDLAQALAAEG